MKCFGRRVLIDSRNGSCNLGELRSDPTIKAFAKSVEVWLLDLGFCGANESSCLYQLTTA